MSYRELSQLDLSRIAIIDRDFAVYLERQLGLQFEYIARKYKISVSYVQQIAKRERLHQEEIRRKWFKSCQSRPIDMGGPRDVWLEFVPGIDPAWQPMAPVT